jgi:hypothetical protein
MRQRSKLALGLPIAGFFVSVTLVVAGAAGLA